MFTLMFKFHSLPSVEAMITSIQIKTETLLSFKINTINQSISVYSNDCVTKTSFLVDTEFDSWCFTVKRESFEFSPFSWTFHFVTYPLLPNCLHLLKQCIHMDKL